MDLAASLGNLGELLRLKNRLEDARKAFDEGLKVVEDLLRTFTPRPDYLALQARLLHNSGVLFKTQNKLAEAEKAQRSALALRQQLVRDHGKDPAHRLDLASSYGELAIVLAGRNRLEQSAETFNQAIAVLHEGSPDWADRPDFLQAEWIHQKNLAMLLKVTGPSQDEKKCLERIKAIEKQLLAAAKP